jgi:anti-anti-sigma factor
MPANAKVFNTDRAGDTLIVIPQGDGLGFRYADVHTEANGIRRSLGQPDIRHLVIDLESLDYFGSEVIGVFITMAREATNRGGNAALCNASEKMQEVLDNMKLFKLWPHFNSRADALQDVQQRTG